MGKILIGIITSYQKIFSRDDSLYHSLGFKKKNACVFYPSCSDYTISAIKKYGSLKGSLLGIKRILRCHPWQKKHIDLVP